MNRKAFPLIGFEQILDILEKKVYASQEDNFPPYNIIKSGENNYQIELAVAGYSDEELSIEVKESRLSVVAEKVNEDIVKGYVHRGLAKRSFQRTFQLADYVEVESAVLKNGILTINLVRNIPEAKALRRIPINGKLPEVNAVKTEELPKAEVVSA